MPGQHPVIVEFGPHIEQESDKPRIMVDLSNPHTRTENLVNQLATVATLPGCDLEKSSLLCRLCNLIQFIFIMLDAINCMRYI